MINISWLSRMNSRRFWFSFGIGLLLVGLLSSSLSSALGVKESRFARLTQGINLSHWFSQAPLTPDNFQTAVTAKDILRIRQMGFKHVRFPLDPDVLFNEDKPESLNSENLQYLDMALDKILTQNLAVIVDLHPNPKTKFKKRLYYDPAFVNAVAKFWQSLAQHLSKRSTELVFLEVLNEPDTKNPQKWDAIQRQLLSAMRAGAPAHTLIAAANQRVGNDWNSIRALEVLTPVEDPNVVYNFHFYKPKQFVSQGATWGWKMLQYFHDVSYPSSPKAVAPLLPKIDNETARRILQNYGEQRWNAEKLEELISRAAAWAQAHKVRLICNEFGVYRKVAPSDDRNVWIRDVRLLLEKYHIGWAMWDYNHGFGVMHRVNGKSIPDVKTLQALFNRAKP